MNGVFENMGKRFFDIAAAAVGLLSLSPLLLFIAWRVRREDGGPSLYRGERVGFHGKPFRIYKFRTMIVDAERLGASSTSDDDARITRFGKLLRKYKLDELPQLINVLIGDMSLVGPRPEVKKFTDLYTNEEMAILSVRPGITDVASIWNSDEGSVLAGSDDPDRAYMELIRPTKLKLQMTYVKDRSFGGDLKIIVLTALAMFQPESKAVREIRGGSHYGIRKTASVD
jgi:lipopolysaccharide/colanic/teichoic acid biosynthesis glycosyltransferase